MSKDQLSIIGADLKVVGSIDCPGELQVDGAVEGDITTWTMTVGESGHILGSVAANTVTIRGSIKGETKADTVAVAKSARLAGGIMHQSLSVELGAVLDGVRCQPQSQ